MKRLTTLLFACVLILTVPATVRGDFQEYDQTSNVSLEAMLSKYEYVIVDFWATWCNPCWRLSAELEKIVTKKNKIHIIKVDVDNNSLVAQKYNVSSLPTLLFFKNGIFVAKEIGFKSEKALQSLIKKYFK